MTMGDVADEANLARRTLYLHFETKEALVNATLEAVIERTRAAMRQGLNLPTGREALRAMLVARIMSRLERVRAFHHSLDDVFRSLYPHSSDDYLSFFQPEAELLIQAMEKGIADESLRAIDEKVTAELLIRATNGFLPSNLSLSEAANPDSVLAKLTTLVEMLLCSLASKESK